MIKWSPSILSVAIALVTAIAPFVQPWMARHPVVMTAAGMLYAVLAHLLPSPIADRQADEPPKELDPNVH